MSGYSSFLFLYAMNIYHHKFKAFVYHTMISLIVAALVTLVVKLVWYPTPYDQICGGLSLLYLVISVDLVLGPLLTFVVFDLKKSKRELVRDLVIVGVLQFVGLLYGMHTVFLARPVAVVFNGKQFDVVTQVQIAEDKLPDAAPDFRRLSLTGPRLLSMRAAQSESERMELMVLSVTGQLRGVMPAFWQDYTLSKNQVVREASSVEDLYKQYPADDVLIDAQIAKSGLNRSQVVFLPIVSARNSWTVLLNKETAEMIGFVPKDASF
ncbi:TfpX/TfpZ family type IV pilin accessory protein [Undibacterium sp. CY21W]|uniref:TfpX/TfpZ family type IV pilin accessory protein n=1 Tax=Undibacterium sp. CY21W TaxID=2762293 RepID=UPI00164A67CC|nr:TfpX/TfpZ family type IV pilin accessory protein [Undibacterium sp. CY21W]MBC3927432.1 pilus assembly protein [Undibacterium sp. CY21W]